MHRGFYVKDIASAGISHKQLASSTTICNVGDADMHVLTVQAAQQSRSAIANAALQGVLLKQQQISLQPDLAMRRVLLLSILFG